jgi:hypothetical protein
MREIKLAGFVTIGDRSPFPMREGTAYDILEIHASAFESGVDGATGALKCAPGDVG